MYRYVFTDKLKNKSSPKTKTLSIFASAELLAEIFRGINNELFFYNFRKILASQKQAF